MRRLRSVITGVLLLGAIVAPSAGSRAAAGDIGYEGPSYSGVSGSHPSQEKPESKLWYSDGLWWGTMWSNAADGFTIYRLDKSTHAWTDTGTVVESLGTYRLDALFDGSKVYLASHRYSTSPGSAAARLTRLSYNAGSKTWSVDPGFPVNISNDRSETLVIAKDTTGMLWATWTNAAGNVYVNHTTCSPTCDDKVWGTPKRLDSIAAIGSAAITASDDISAVVAFGGKIGVYWSNQVANASYFAVHADGAPDTSWSRETALSGTDISDDHINFASDGSTLFVAVKTSYDSSSAPETFVMKRTPSGAWSSTVASLGAQRLSRPIVTYDRTNDRVHWFASDVQGGYTYTKSSAASNVTLPTGKGQPVLYDASAADMNDVTSTKQAVDASSGMVVMATDNVSKLYFHAEDNLGGTAGLTVGFSATPQYGEAPVDVQFTDTSTGAPSAWNWSFGDGTNSTQQSPLHRYTAPGIYTVSLTATNASGSRTETKTGYIEVVAPKPLAASFTTDRSSGAAPLAVQFTDSSTGKPTSWSWNFGDGTTSTQQNPSHTYGAAGTYDVTLTVTNAAGATHTTTAVGAITVTNESVFVPVADAYLRTDRATSNYGTDAILRVRSAATGYRSILKFDVTGVTSQPKSAKLRLFVTDASPHAGDLFLVGNGWTEAGVNDSNAPAHGATPNVVGGEALLGSWYEWDVAPLVTGNGTYSFMLESTNGNSAYYSSREGANPPQLVVGSVAAPVALAAAFSADRTTAETNQAVSFTDASTGSPTSWSWNFGDGATSTAQNPQHAYAAAGNYTVSLTVYKGTGSATTTKNGYITVTAPQALDAAFTLDSASGPAPHAVQFTDTSLGAPTSWNWQFGDGVSSTVQNPQHTYAAPGTYDVSLTVGKAGATDTEVVAGAVTVTSAPAGSALTAVADALLRSDRTTSNYGSAADLRVRRAATEYRSLVRFDVAGMPSNVTSAKVRMFVTDASPAAGDLYLVGNGWTENGVTFANQPVPGSTPTATGGAAVAGTWHEWDVTSALAGKPAGSFSFTVIGTNSNSAYYSSREGANAPQLVISGVAGPAQLHAEFSGTPVSGTAPLGVQFSDQSSGKPPATWAWNFGDGNTSDSQSPFHQYAAAGTYSVSLTVGDGAGTDTMTKAGYITVNGPTTASTAFVATEDAHVRSDGATSNYGSATFLRLRQGSPTSYESLVKFDVAGLSAAPSRAILRLYITDGSPSAGAVSSVSPSAWTESTVTWATKPAAGAQIAADMDASTGGTWVEWDVTAAVAGNGAVSFSLANNSTNSAYFDSREGTNPPQLVVTP